MDPCPNKKLSTQIQCRRQSSNDPTLEAGDQRGSFTRPPHALRSRQISRAEPILRGASTPWFRDRRPPFAGAPPGGNGPAPHPAGETPRPTPPAACRVCDFFAACVGRSDEEGRRPPSEGEPGRPPRPVRSPRRAAVTSRPWSAAIRSRAQRQGRPPSPSSPARTHASTSPLLIPAWHPKIHTHVEHLAKGDGGRGHGCSRSLSVKWGGSGGTGPDVLRWGGDGLARGGGWGCRASVHDHAKSGAWSGSIADLADRGGGGSKKIRSPPN